MKKCSLIILIIANLLFLQKTQAANQKPLMFFDLGMTVVMTVKDPKTDDFSQIYYMPGALSYLKSLKAAGYKLGLLVNVPDEWGNSLEVKIAKIKSFVAERWTDHEPMDWSLFDAGIFVPPKDEFRKPAPFLFKQAVKLATDQGVHAIFQGEDVKEVQTAKDAGMFAYQVQDGPDFFLKIDSIASFRGNETAIPDAHFEARQSPAYSKLGTLNAILIENLKGVPYVVYLHGYGGSGESAYQDLRPEIENSEVLRQVNWIFPDSPTGGWFAIEAQDREGRPDVEIWQATLKTTRLALRNMITSAKLNPQNVIWAGFSQGAITATDYVLHSSTSTGGLIINSGIYFNSTDWHRNAKALVGTRFFMSHDRHDSVLPFSEAKKLESLLLENALVGQLETHSKGHTLPAGFIAKSIRGLLQESSSAHQDRPRKSESKYCRSLFLSLR